MEGEDLYKILGVSRDATSKEIKSAYRKIARENHPDLNPDDQEAEERFKAASRAFEVLGDDTKRKLYDEFGADALREGFDAEQARQYRQWQEQVGGGFAGQGPGGQRFYYSNASGADFQDIFGSFFRGRGPFESGGNYGDFGSFYSGPMKGQDLEAELRLPFLTAVQGGELEIRVGGKNIKVRIPAGADDGEKLRLNGQGSPAPAGAPRGSKPGDLLLTIRVDDHPLLRREGLNLYLDLPVTVGEAVKGAKIPVPTPHGEYNVTIPSGVHSGAKLRLRGKGVHRGDKKGDFFVVLQIQAPDHIDDAIREAAEKMEEGYSQPVRRDLHL